MILDSLSQINPKELGALIIGLVICLGIPVSLLPQVFKLIRHRSSEGVSFLTFGIAALNAFSSFLNVTILNWSFIERCQQNGYLLCFDKILICTQMIMLFYFYSLCLCLCMLFYWFPKKNEKQVTYYEDLDEPDAPKGPTIRQRLEFIVTNFGFLLLGIILLGLTTAGITLMWYFGRGSFEAKTFGHVMGYIATGLVFVQWSPQIIRTIIERSSGNFSVVMLMIMTPSSFGILAYMMLLSDQHFSTWLSYLCSGVQQVILLCLCLFFDLRGKCAPKDGKVVNEDEEF